MTNEKEELKPCPFCGKRDVFEGAQKTSEHYVWCGAQVFCGGTASFESWQSAFCWKELAEKDEALKIAEEKLYEASVDLIKLKEMLKVAEEALFELWDDGCCWDTKDEEECGECGWCKAKDVINKSHNRLKEKTK